MTTITTHAIANTYNELRAVLTTVETSKTTTAKVSFGKLEASHKTSGHNFNRLRHAIATAAWELEERIKKTDAMILDEQEQILQQLQSESWDAIEMLKKAHFEVMTVTL